MLFKEFMLRLLIVLKMNTLLIVSLAVFFSYRYEVIAKSPLHIVNGTTADDGEFPYMVQVRAYTYFACGGSILAPQWILTAGHCVEGGGVDSIVYGTNKLYQGNEPGNYSVIKVKNWFQHPKFQRTNESITIYDVAVLQLEETILFSATAQPIQIAGDDSIIPFHVQGVLSGWGDNGDGSGSMSYLQKINLQLLTDEECTKKINDYSGKTSFISTHNLCSDDYHNGECSGDSGSPYVINGTQYGLVSWSYKPCGIVPGAYSRITNPEYRNWIKNITNI